MEFIFLPALVLVITVAVVIFVVMSLKYKNNSEEIEGGGSVLKNLYIYLVLFATLMMSIGGSVSAFMAIADLVSPPNYTQSFEMYKQDQQYKPTKENVDKQKQLTDEELKKQYDQMVMDEKQRAKERAINSLIKSFGWIIIPLPIFIFFQRKIRKA